MWSYAEVEDVLAMLHMCATDKIGSLRGRLQHFQKLGLKPSSPGKGTRIAYTLEDIAKWALALEFAEFGVDPIGIKTIVDRVWNDVCRPLVDGPQGADELLMTNPEMLSRTYYYVDTFSHRVVTGNAVAPGLDGVKRVLVVNLSWLHRDARWSEKHASQQGVVSPAHVAPRVAWSLPISP